VDPTKSAASRTSGGHARTLKNQTEVTVHGRHYMQEDCPDEVGAALAGFVKGLRG